MIVVIREEARGDLHVGYRFYEEQAAGLGRYFLECIFADIDAQAVRLDPRICRWLSADAVEAVSLRDLLRDRWKRREDFGSPRLPPRSGLDSQGAQIAARCVT